jgi:hypothetical protein
MGQKRTLHVKLSSQRPLTQVARNRGWLNSSAYIHGCRWIVELEQFQKQVVWGGDHNVPPTVMFPQPVRGSDSLGLQALPDVAEVGDLNAKMMDGPAALISWSLIVNVKTPGPHGEEDVSRPAQFFIEENLGTHVLAPPIDSRVDVACKQMSMMEIKRHDSFPSI